MNKLEDFLRSTESQTSINLEPAKALTLTYPFIYISHITNVELQHYLKQGILHQTPETEDDVQFFLKSTGLKFLGYVTLSVKVLSVINALSEHTIMVKRSKSSESPITEQVVNMLLLKE